MTSTTQANDKLKQCDDALNSCLKYSELLKLQVDRQQEYILLVEKQRDRAHEQLAKSVDYGLPFYFWLVLGAAGATVLIRGVK